MNAFGMHHYTNRFMREGDLLIRRNHVRRRKARYFFLCSDVLVQAKRSGDSAFHRVVMLRPLRVQVNESNHSYSVYL